MADEEELRIPLLEEEVRLGTRVVERGRVHVRTKVDTREELVEAALRQEAVHVERVPIGRVVETAPPVREEGDVLIVPVLEERLVVRTELVLKEEIRLQLRTTTETVRVPVTVRSMQAEVERLDTPAGNQIEPEGGKQSG